MKIGRRNNKLNNAGMSLVELIVVIAIMAVLVGLIGFSLSLLTGSHARECAQKLSAEMDSTKTGCMSRFEEYMELKYIDTPDINKGIDRTGFYTVRTVKTINNQAQSADIINSDPVYKYVGSSKVKVEITTDSGSTYTIDKDNAGECVVITYNRSSGAYKKATFTSASGVSSEDYISQMQFKSGLRTYTIKFVTDTGKHSIEN